MTIYYADSSVLIKRHVQEIGTDWVIGLTSDPSAHIFVTAQITYVEGLSALNRRLREQSLSSTQYNAAANNWMLFCANQYSLTSLSSQTLLVCKRLVETYPLRAYDAVQLATASVSNQGFVAAGQGALIFLSSDRRLLDAARAEGFEVDDPNLHP